MGYLSSLGKNSKTTLYKHESHKLHEELQVTAGQTVKRGQPVKLTNDGDVTPWAAADGQTLLIGFCMMDAAAGEMVTIIARGFVTFFCLSNAALNAGPVTWSSFDSATEVNGTTGFNKVAALGGGGANIQECIGWCLDEAAGANELVRVMMKN